MGSGSSAAGNAVAVHLAKLTLDRHVQCKLMEWYGMGWSGVEWSGVELSGVEWSGLEWNKTGYGLHFASTLHLPAHLHAPLHWLADNQSHLLKPAAV